MNKLWNYEDYVKDLSHTNKLIRRRAFEALETHYPNRYTDEISKLIGDEDSHLACMAPRYLAEHKTVQHGPKILDCFRNSSGNVPSNCASALGRMKYEPALEIMLEQFSSADSTEHFYGILEYLGEIKRDECREALHSVVVRTKDHFELQTVAHNLLQHYHPDDVPLVLDKYFEFGIEDHYSDSLLKTISSVLGGDSYFRELTEHSRHNLLETPKDVIDLFISRNPIIELQSDQQANIISFLSNKSFDDLATMIMFAARGIINKRYQDTETPVWLEEIRSQDSACLIFLEEMSRRTSVWNQVKNTEYAGRNLVALVLSILFALIERSAYLKALSPKASLDDLIQALTNTGSDFPELLQDKIVESKPVSALNATLTEGLLTWGDIWTVRLMGRIGSSDFLPALIRVLNDSDSLDYINEDARRAICALDESAIEKIIEVIEKKEIEDWASFAILEHLPYAKCYDLAIDLWNDGNSEMNSDELFACCLEGIGDPRGIDKLRHIYAHENDATYIGDSLECLAVLNDVELPELHEINQKRKESEKRQKTRTKELNELTMNYSRKKAESNFGTLGQILPFKRDAPKIGRNEPCPCGSGKKYKKCCFDK